MAETQTRTNKKLPKLLTEYTVNTEVLILILCIAIFYVRGGQICCWKNCQAAIQISEAAKRKLPCVKPYGGGKRCRSQTARSFPPV